MRTVAPLALGLALAVNLAACKGGDSSGSAAPGSASGATPPATGAVSITGSGSTFINPLMAKWIEQYKSVQPNAKINYQSVGSGAGIKAITDKTVELGASDTAMNDDQIGAAKGILHVPVTIGAVAVSYNVQGAPDHLKLTPEVLADVMLGNVKKWNDAKITALNPDAKLPAQDIGVVYRSDGSGTTAVFTDYLSKVSPDWKSKVGTGTTVKWPVGTGANKNDGVANQIKQTPGAIGYIELAYAIQTKQPVAMLKNRAGNFVAPSLEGTTAAAAGISAKMPPDMRMTLTDAEGDAAYPIASFTYVLVYQDMADAAKAGAVVSFLWWAIHDGQKLGPALTYAPLPAEVVAKDEEQLKKVMSAGKPVLAAK